MPLGLASTEWLGPARGGRALAAGAAVVGLPQAMESPMHPWGRSMRATCSYLRGPEDLGLVAVQTSR